MEHEVEVLARWLASNPLVFFAIALVTAVAIMASAWYLLIAHAARAGELSRRVWTRFGAPWLAGRIPDRWTSFLASLTVYAVIAFVAAFAAVVAFVEIADEIAAGEDIAAFDEAFTATLRDRVTLPTLKFFALITQLGNAWFLTALASAVTLVLWWRGRRVLAAIWIVAVAGNGLLTRALKEFFERTRPLHEHGLVTYDTWSFPSGHASASLAVYAMLLYLLLRGRDRSPWHLTLMLATATLILLVGFSRVFLQVHYPSDVVAGYIVAGAWLCLCIVGAEVSRGRSGHG